jgi:branched-chain amino acid transport system substrate-binding protein
MNPSARRRGWFAFLMPLVLLAAVACGTPEDPTAGEGEETEPITGDATEGGDQAAGDVECPITIGISLPLTGDFSEPGKNIQQGYELWAKVVNDGGGLLGCDVELIFRDDASDPNRAVSDYEHLITRQNVDFVFGPFSSRLVEPTAAVAEEEKMLFLEPAGAAPSIFEHGYEYLFYAAPAVADDHYNYLFEWLEALPDDQKPQSVAVASLDDPFAQGTAYGLRDQLADAGYDIVVDEVYPPDQTDFSSIAARVADANADLFVGGTQFEDSVGLTRAFQELGYQPKMAAMSTGPTLPEFTEAVGDAANGIVSPAGWSSRTEFPSNVEFVAAFEEEFGSEAHEDAANAYTVGEILQQAVEAVGCADPSDECQTELRDYIRDNEFETVVGPLSWDEAGRPQSAHFLQQWQEGRIEIVLPEEEAVQTAEILYPKPEW